MKFNSKGLVKVICLIILFFLLFQNSLEQKFTLLKGLDEMLPWIIVLAWISLIVINKGKIRINRKVFDNNSKILLSIIFIILLGLLGNYCFKYQKTSAIFFDILLVFKGFITYIFADFLISDSDFKMCENGLNKMLKIISIVIFLMILINYKMNIFPYIDIRNGLPSQQLFFSHPTYLASFSVAIIALLTFSLERCKQNRYYILIMLFVIISTQRNKAIIFVGIYLLLYYFIIIKNKRVKLGIILITLILSYFIGKEQINTYIANPDWARPALTLTSIQIANDHFPLGSGFATFASWNSGVYYSPLYYIYNINNIYGLSPNYYMYVGDTFWPAILGQFGYIGIILVIYIIILIFNRIRIENYKYKYFAKLCILIYLLILSTSETSFMSPVAPLLCLIMAI